MLRLQPLLRSTGVAGSLLVLGAAAPAAAVTLGFDCITNNLAGDCAIGEAQLTAAVSDPGGGLIGFTFYNAGVVASSITDIYWDDDGTLHSIFSISDTPGFVEFSNPATPGNLPGASSVGFLASDGFSTDSDPPAQRMGVNPGEALLVTFLLLGGVSFADAIQDLSDGSLRIGIHVQGYTSGGSESFVSRSTPVPVPEPGTFALVGGGMLALAAVRRRG